jgi:hypothetical protein
MRLSLPGRLFSVLNELPSRFIGADDELQWHLLGKGVPIYWSGCSGIDCCALFCVCRAVGIVASCRECTYLATEQP